LVGIRGNDEKTKSFLCQGKSAIRRSTLIVIPNAEGGAIQCDTDSESGISGLVRFLLGIRKIITVKTKQKALQDADVPRSSDGERTLPLPSVMEL